MFPSQRLPSCYPSARLTLQTDQGNISSSLQPASGGNHPLPTQMPSMSYLQRKMKQMDLTKQEFIGQESWRAEKGPQRQAVIPQPQMNKSLSLGGGLFGQIATAPHCLGQANQRCPPPQPLQTALLWLMPFCTNSAMSRESSKAPAWSLPLSIISLPQDDKSR